ncbi:hypothetical protein ALPO108162_04220 [Alicyclobacillus pomorum]
MKRAQVGLKMTCHKFYSITRSAEKNAMASWGTILWQLTPLSVLCVAAASESNGGA